MTRKGRKRPSAGAKAARNRYGASQYSNANNRRGRDNDAESIVTQIINNGFTMKDEARNTGSHQLSYNHGKLRDRPVAFVSAGYIEPLKDLKMFPEDTSALKVAPIEVPETIVEDPEPEASDSPSPDTMESTSLQVNDLIEATAEVEAEMSVPRSETPVKEDPMDVEDNVTETKSEALKESEQVFFFDLGGDESIRREDIPPPVVPERQSPAYHSDTSDEVILFKGRSSHAQRSSAVRNATPANPPAISPEVAGESSVVTVTQTVVASSSKVTIEPSNEDRSSSSRLPQKRKNSRRDRKQTMEEKEKQDEEDAILADYIANMAEDSGEDDILTQQLKALANTRDLGGFDNAVDFGSADEDDEASSTSASEDGADERDEDDREMDEADVDDETLAQLFAKQEELGIGGDDLVLFSENTFQKRRNKTKTDKYNSSAQMFDEWTDPNFDWDVAQMVHRKTKRSKQPPAFNVEDPELEEQLRSAWTNDRTRKKHRKMEREQLRAQGLLGKNVNPDDLHVKYQEGMTMDDVKAEMVKFLIDTREELQFPPLDHHARRCVHELAHKFNIKSQSTGDKDNRRPVLYRTKRTLVYSALHVEEVERHVELAAQRIRRRYFPRMDKKTPRPPREGGGGNRSGMKAVTYREGEIVAGSVPELGQENKGRAMLEKMGWTKGMGLGTLDNKGILEPVKQVVKRSKAGLG